MNPESQSLRDQRLAEFLRRRNAILTDNLGFRVHGSVWVIQGQRQDGTVLSAVKFHEQWEPYRRERNVYLRLRDAGVEEVCGHAVPQLIDYDDEHLAIEMSIVMRPFVLDFGGAYLDRPPDYDTETLEQWRIEKEEQFAENWPQASLILAALRRHRIYVTDVNPGNIGFVETEAPE